MWEYSDKVKEHFTNPKNVGSIENADAIGEAGALSCGDKLKLYLKIENNIIANAKFQTFGCGSAVAASSVLTEMLIGKTLDEARKITNKQIADELNGLPPEKMHCSVMGREALENALKNYYQEDWSELEDEQEVGSTIICHCFSVTEQQIIDAILNNGAKTFDDISKITSAGLACGRCRENIKAIIARYIKNDTEKKLTPVQKIIKINSVIETVVSPELQKDFGDIELINVEGNNVYVRLKGHCSQCANAKLTLKNFVETKLKELVDDDIIVFEEK
ncbi:MAG: Fe-S cluster assembly protein NifU [Candidatus Gastranaerophilales bacterium]|nr:Fe-S cluster assembly protein NifU [Candidatus Gastranaerophilales bacterium]